MNPLITIVLPVYNVAPYLAECLDSAINQTYRNLEIICVDDGSTDSSPEILKNYAAKDSRIRIITKANAGLGAARNTGLDAANGYYIYFLDSDDKIELCMCEELVNYDIENGSLDMILFNRELIFDPPELVEKYAGFKKYTVMHADYSGIRSGIDLASPMQKNGDYPAATWLRFCRREFLLKNKLRFPEGILHEDELFAVCASCLPSKVAFIDNPYFKRRVRANSIMTVSGSFRHILGCVYTAFQIVKFANLNTCGMTEEMNLFLAERIRIMLQKAKAYLREIENASDEFNTIPWEKYEISSSLVRALLFAKPFFKTNYRNTFIPPARKTVSIVIPFYNAAEYLVECLLSIQEQSMQDFEVICVDNGSTDNTPELLEFFAQCDKRFTVIRQNHTTTGAARNSGMAYASGNYLFFPEATDFIAPNLLQQTVAKAESDDSDIVVFRYAYFDSETQSVISNNKFSPVFTMHSRSFNRINFRDQILSEFSSCSSCRLFRREFIMEQKLRFQDVVQEYDLSFVYPAMVLAQRISIVNSPLYYRRKALATVQDVNESMPLAFYDALLAAKTKLQETGLFMEVELSYIRSALTRSLAALFSMKEKETFSRTYDALRKYIFEKALSQQMVDF